MEQKRQEKQLNLQLEMFSIKETLSILGNMKCPNCKEKLVYLHIFPYRNYCPTCKIYPYEKINEE